MQRLHFLYQAALYARLVVCNFQLVSNHFSAWPAFPSATCLLLLLLSWAYRDPNLSSSFFRHLQSPVSSSLHSLLTCNTQSGWVCTADREILLSSVFFLLLQYHRPQGILGSIGEDRRINDPTLR